MALPRIANIPLSEFIWQTLHFVSDWSEFVSIFGNGFCLLGGCKRVPCGLTNRPSSVFEETPRSTYFKSKKDSLPRPQSDMWYNQIQKMPKQQNFPSKSFLFPCFLLTRPSRYRTAWSTYLPAGLHAHIKKKLFLITGHFIGTVGHILSIQLVLDLWPLSRPGFLLLSNLVAKWVAPDSTAFHAMTTKQITLVVNESCSC